MPVSQKKQILEMVIPIKSEINLAKFKIDYNIFAYEYITNLSDLNSELINGKIECTICYNMIFYHHSLHHRIGPIAYQCNYCCNNLMCSECALKIKTCPFCKVADSHIEPASELILDEIQKIKFKCQFGCRVSLSASEMLLHLAFFCKEKMHRINTYTIKTRELNFCKYFCNLKPI